MASGMSTTVMKMACWLHCSCPDDDDTQKCTAAKFGNFGELLQLGVCVSSRSEYGS